MIRDDVFCVYFRDVRQNHLMRILSVVAVEKPDTINAEDVFEEKVRKI
jgi:glucose-6-phosphate 1-dehydrogenase